MAEKFSEITWTAFTKKQKLDLEDAPLVKALAKFDKTSEAKPEPRLEALQDLIEEIKKQVTAQAKRKKELGDKVFGEVKDKLYALLDSRRDAAKGHPESAGRSQRRAAGTTKRKARRC